MTRKNNLSKIILIKAIALITCIAPALTATLSYFPIWLNKGDACVISGLALCLITISLIPFYKQVGGILKSPSAYVIWLILFIIFFLLSKIADEMTVISFIGFISNLIGAMLFKLARKLEGKEKNND